ncbi:acyl-CoA thioesterase [Alkalibacter mobilis]|uniref:acyl-CoA thioesterase n=1 Tax=Alkalibacter mobilis TaxID=2787712 RepID=UPI00189F5D92|nr:thioesterase family protein [Alkalibacter mobilis]MBF7096188.1 acyl-CoA thioesterase [Alkalibacter mobilis]
MPYMGYSRKVNYYETDAMGIVHHSNYIRWFEEARIDYLEHLGLPYHKLEELGITLPVLHVDCTYKSPARFGDEFVIKLGVEDFTGLRISMTYVVEDPDSKEIFAMGKSKHAFLDENLKPLRLKQNFPEVYKIFFNIKKEDEK